MTLAAFLRVETAMQAYVAAGGSIMLATFVINVCKQTLSVKVCG
jgi:hypothetical protein